ncbi:hypothetical protein AGMMS49545_15900 [Betaproteobacteria bacterium]|nr:hypothetical protein AGMMS49545_15900 [Betaproteobacteria bacterium]GHU43266.1 hypothetical protein AGMMS50289_09380 [Betaproteobacteria bacterium]
MQKFDADMTHKISWKNWMVGFSIVFIWAVFDDWMVDGIVVIPGSFLLLSFVGYCIIKSIYGYLKNKWCSTIIGNVVLFVVLICFIRLVGQDLQEISRASEIICNKALYCSSHECVQNRESKQNGIYFSRFGKFSKRNKFPISGNGGQFYVTAGHTTMLITYIGNYPDIGLKASKGVLLSEETKGCYIMR